MSRKALIKELPVVFKRVSLGVADELGYEIDVLSYCIMMWEDLFTRCTDVVTFHKDP
jgi:hypothetical protein